MKWSSRSESSKLLGLKKVYEYYKSLLELITKAIVCLRFMSALEKLNTVIIVPEQKWLF